MPKAKGKNRRKKFNYNVNRKKLKQKMKKKATPRIECNQIREAWDDSKSVAQNLAEMGLASDPNKCIPIQKQKIMHMEIDTAKKQNKIIRKPYVLNELIEEASLPEKRNATLSRDMIEYVQYMIENHGDNCKEMARDEKNYYQDTPKQIKRKIELYKRYHPKEYSTFMDSLQEKKMDT
ncbi:nucleolar protein 16 [Latimeria chalumnae]|uniref:Nucleolar protein 16 n=1 Tax=Latimeria chalumnae TaxID=7897 RepID=H3B4S7_LATCH|nr:PREDICTED: nucleolar protein 16 [Latimeria chalumnae]|eukprot:XP_005993436.1 PREDICTED: nucleolar protein 16 [Latimeria chalumnae]